MSVLAGLPLVGGRGGGNRGEGEGGGQGAGRSGEHRAERRGEPGAERCAEGSDEGGTASGAGRVVVRFDRELVAGSGAGYAAGRRAGATPGGAPRLTIVPDVGSRRPSGAEPRRPSTRGRVDARPRTARVADCPPRRVPARWPMLTMLALAVCIVVAGIGLLAGGTAPAVPEQTATVSVRSGQTLWDLAREYTPDSDPAAVVDRIQRLNDLGGVSLVPGMPLTVPVQYAAGAGS